MNYPLPLIDEFLNDFDKSMWFLSLDMASGFWAILMTLRAKHISAFICPLGHFQWLRMPFGLKNAPLIYQQVIDNALWGYHRLPAHLKAEVDSEVLEGVGVKQLDVSTSLQVGSSLEEEPGHASESAGATSESESSHPDDVQAIHNPPESEKTVFQLNIPAPACMGPVLSRSSYIDDIAAGATDWDELCEMIDRLLYRLRYWGLSVSLPKSSFGKESIQFLSHEVSREGIRAMPKIVKEIENLRFPQTLKGIQSFPDHHLYYIDKSDNFCIMIGRVYKIIHCESNACYIGSTIDDLRYRWQSHKMLITNGWLVKVDTFRFMDFSKSMVLLISR
ncbi:hypothetical protein Poli38472_007395 [Pythium oligandrum]|uniref:Reverse transcriptase domain-containing protein n=1 Tax=Pythium oligandrum TaxID=41045 RepID=A0A8K1FRM3_PYTOL|nr:hypothetical protein Poli38472_007395 [Pythium oligandrum]|eukprot:TMW67723.1 hypothetical protein Poli38472_007395 [Pythium oligandrum]